ncbi:MAG: tetratricopeptide repeat protein, partial [Cyanobacteria bacterium]|nr:tetratricopeptide repeat protein [Cyanobacteriota bacterium]
DSGRYSAAEQFYKEALNRNKSDVEDYSQRQRLHEEYGAMLRKLGRTEDAANLTRESDAIRLETTNSTDTVYVQKLFEEGKANLGNRQFEKAEKAFQTAYNRCLATRDQYLLVDIKLLLATAKVNMSKQTEAELLLRQVLKESTGQKHEQALRVLAICVINQKRYAEAEELLLQALSNNDINKHECDMVRQFCKASLLNCYWEQKKFDKIDELLPSILSESASQAQCNCLVSAGNMVGTRNLPKAEEIFRKALKMSETVQMSDRDRVAILRNLLSVLSAEKKNAEVKSLALQELELLTKSKSSQFAEEAQSYCALSDIFVRLKMLDKTKLCLERTVLSLEKQPPGDELDAGILQKVTETYRAIGMFDESKRCLERISSICEQHNSERSMDLQLWVADQLVQFNEQNKANEIYKRALDFFKSRPKEKIAQYNDRIHRIASGFYLLGKYEESERLMENEIHEFGDADQKARCLELRVAILHYLFKTRENEVITKELAEGRVKAFSEAWNLLESGRAREALSFVNRLINLPSMRQENQTLTFMKALCHQLMGEKKEAESCYRSIVRQFDTMGSDDLKLAYRLHFSVALEAMGKSQEAKQFVQKAMLVKQTAYQRFRLSEDLSYYETLFKRSNKTVEADRYKSLSSLYRQGIKP